MATTTTKKDARNQRLNKITCYTNQHYLKISECTRRTHARFTHKRTLKVIYCADTIQLRSIYVNKDNTTATQ